MSFIMQWQFYPSFRFFYHQKEKDEDFGFFDHVLHVAFWQFRWRSQT